MPWTQRHRVRCRLPAKGPQPGSAEGLSSCTPDEQSCHQSAARASMLPTVFATPACVANGLYMGLTEFEALAAPADWWLLQSLGPRFAVFAAPNDTWFKARADSLGERCGEFAGTPTTVWPRPGTTSGCLSAPAAAEMEVGRAASRSPWRGELLG
jgi:hypothetical protein